MHRYGRRKSKSGGSISEQITKLPPQDSKSLRRAARYAPDPSCAFANSIRITSNFDRMLLFECLYIACKCYRIMATCCQISVSLTCVLFPKNILFSQDVLGDTSIDTASRHYCLVLPSYIIILHLRIAIRDRFVDDQSLHKSCTRYKAILVWVLEPALTQEDEHPAFYLCHQPTRHPADLAMLIDGLQIRSTRSCQYSQCLHFPYI